NVAWILASAGKRVLVADWDLESPGLHRFFHPFIDAAVFEDQSGVINLIRDYEDQSAHHDPRRPANWHEEVAQARRYAFPLNATFPNDGELHFLSAGRQNQDYKTSVGALDWDAFLENRDGALFFGALRASMRRDYDYTLIDSRTGLSDFADICTMHLPDALIDCFTLSEQGIDGAAQVARRVRTTYSTRNIRVLPVPMRVDQAEKEKVDAGRALAMQRFGPTPDHLADEERQLYWAAVEVPYSAFYAFEETLATFGDRPGAPNSLLASYERLTAFLTDGAVTRMPPMEESIRLRGLARFERRLMATEDEVVLRYSPKDQVWAEWIEQLLRHTGVRVFDPQRHPQEQVKTTARTMTLLSHANERSEGIVLQRDEYGFRPPLAVYLSDIRTLPGYPLATSAHVYGQPGMETAERILQLVGRRDRKKVQAAVQSAGRFPGTPPEVFNAPARNLRFTGREDDLRELRRLLTTAGSMALLPASAPIALQGMGGIGKTQMAMEYVYRFQSAYDMVWWITADPPQFIDVALGDLASRLQLPTSGRVTETTRAVLNALERGEPYARWLVVFDNADDIESVKQFLPRGHGHVLVTSRNLQWRDTVETIPIEVFARRESITYLRHRVPKLSTEEANRVAEALGDLPIAVAAAGAWLADTGTPVAEYLDQIVEHGPRVLPGEHGSAQSVQKTWDLSLDRLKSRSPGAYRLLQLCSVLAPEIALELIHSDEMGRALRLVDDTTSERMERGKLVQHINRLALLRLDAQSGVHVHRLLQHVIRDRMTPDELGEARHAMHLLLTAARPRGEVDSPQSWPRFRMLWPHLEVSDAASCTDASVRELLVDRVRYLWLRGAYSQGERFARRIDGAWTELLTARQGQPEVQRVLRRQLLSLRFNLANLLREQGRFTESRELNEATLAEQREFLGDTSPYTLMTLGSLAADLKALGLYQEALELDKNTYSAWAQDFGEEYPRTLSAQFNLAASYRLVGDFRQARKHDDEALRKRRLVLGPTDPYTLISASSFGRDLREGGEYEHSVTVLRAVVDDYVATLGDAARGTLNARVNLAVSLRSAGAPEEAGRLLEDTYVRLLDNLGAGNPDTLACRLSRATNVLARGDIEQAKGEMEGVENAYREQLGEKHPHTIVCVNNLAAVERAAGTLTEARRFARLAAELFDEVLPKRHPYTLAARLNLAVCEAELKNTGQALHILREIRGHFVHVLGPEHPDTLRCEGNLVLTLAEAGLAGQEVDEVDLLRRLRSRLGIHHPAVVAFEARRYMHRVLDPHPF
ncbi:MAG TPA: FxSxx-COOH system tetratricopeptide repeat protein, partial [Actinoplanes sp.]